MTTARDICLQALKDSGIIGVGQTALAEDINDSFTALNQMLAQWRRKRFLIPYLSTISKISTAAQTYSMGPGGDFDTGTGISRPDKIESAYFRQKTGQPNNEVDFGLTIIPSREQYNQISLKTLQTFPNWVYYEPTFPLGTLYFWPIPQANIYEMFVSVKSTLQRFVDLNTIIVLPEEYEAALRFCLAQRLLLIYQLPPNENLMRLAKDALNVVRGANVQLASLEVQSELIRPGLYNVYSDSIY